MGGRRRRASWTQEVGVQRVEKGGEPKNSRFFSVSVPDLQSTWLLLLHCGTPRVNYVLRVLPPRQNLEVCPGV